MNSNKCATCGIEKLNKEYWNVKEYFLKLNHYIETSIE